MAIVGGLHISYLFQPPDTEREAVPTFLQESHAGTIVSVCRLSVLLLRQTYESIIQPYLMLTLANEN